MFVVDRCSIQFLAWTKVQVFTAMIPCKRLYLSWMINLRVEHLNQPSSDLDASNNANSREEDTVSEMAAGDALFNVFINHDALRSTTVTPQSSCNQIVRQGSRASLARRFSRTRCVNHVCINLQIGTPLTSLNFTLAASAKTL